MALLSLQEISVRFGGPWLLEGATLNIERGERVCLLDATARASPRS